MAFAASDLPQPGTPTSMMTSGRREIERLGFCGKTDLRTFQPGFQIGESAQFEPIVFERIIFEQAAIFDGLRLPLQDRLHVIGRERAVFDDALRDDLPGLMERHALQRTEDGVTFLSGDVWICRFRIGHGVEKALHDRGRSWTTGEGSGFERLKHAAKHGL